MCPIGQLGQGRQNLHVKISVSKSPCHIKPGIRRLHPGRERAKAIKKLQEQMSRKAEPKADPWDTSDEVWGTVDLPPVTARDSNAVEGRRLTPGTGLQQAGDESLTGRGGRRMTWRDQPVTATIDQLMPGFTVAEDGDYYSRYVSRDK